MILLFIRHSIDEKRESVPTGTSTHQKEKDRAKSGDYQREESQIQIVFSLLAEAIHWPSLLTPME